VEQRHERGLDKKVIRDREEELSLEGGLDILIRHYFPGVDLSSLSDEDMVRYGVDIEWLEKHLSILHSNAIAEAFGGD
jgi:hypothetical protein